MIVTCSNQYSYLVLFQIKFMENFLNVAFSHQNITFNRYDSVYYPLSQAHSFQTIASQYQWA